MSTKPILSPVKLLLAVDGSEHSQAAIQLIHDMPLPLDSFISVLAVLIPREAGLKTYALRHFLEQTEEKLKDKGAKIESNLLAGHPAQEILKQVDQLHPDLVVMGAKGMRATLGILLGGVVQQVVEHARSPVLVVRAPYTGVQNILFVTDGSVQSEQAAGYLTSFPFAHEAKLQVMHVLPPEPTTEVLSHTWMGANEALFAYPYPDIEQQIAKTVEEEAKQGEALLSGIKTFLDNAGIVCETNLVRGDAATEILEFSKTNAVDMIVAGSRGLGGFEGWLLGSVSRKLVHYANCSVLIVKGE